MANVIVVGILALAVGGAVRFIIKAKKKGTHCLGCPSAGCCPSKTRGGCQLGEKKGDTTL